jgi:hypothetical protein
MFRISLFVGIIFTSLIFPQIVEAQRVSIEGFILDLKTSTKIKEVDIFDKVSGIGTTSNESGYFKLLLNRGKIELEISETGYQTLDKVFDLCCDTIVDLQLTLKKDVIEKLQVAGSNNQVEANTTTSARFLKPRHR